MRDGEASSRLWTGRSSGPSAFRRRRSEPVSRGRILTAARRARPAEPPAGLLARAHRPGGLHGGAGGRARPRPVRAAPDRPAAGHRLPQVLLVREGADLDGRAAAAVHGRPGRPVAREVELVEQRDQAWRRGHGAPGAVEDPKSAGAAGRWGTDPASARHSGRLAPPHFPYPPSRPAAPGACASLSRGRTRCPRRLPTHGTSSSGVLPWWHRRWSGPVPRPEPLRSLRGA